MSDTSIALNNFLLLGSSGAFANFEPEQLLSNHDKLEQFLLSNGDSLSTLELYSLYELQFYLALLTKHDIEAKAMLDRLVDQFGANAKSQRLKLLQSIYLEAIGKRDEALALVNKSPNELKLARRLVTFGRKADSNDNEDYISTLTYYLDLQPTDLVTWSELGHEYSKIGHYDKAIYCFKEILLQDALIYPIFYKVGLNYYYNFLQEEKNLKTERKDKLLELLNILINSRNNYLRAVEIFDDYTKAWVGIYIITQLGSFNDKLKKLGDGGIKEVKEYLEYNEKLSKLSDKRIQELAQPEEYAKILNDIKK
ncbi:uncharacterized protein RJT21DRAFT_34107 [Scheffersomyces amazonensis]|uniref:uncharacterized protein n=1 Tax=Scheffersomyces amazonensis TaxID=1078765 RepID=UPI00315DEBA7